jgi:hypothetical protein
MKRRTWWRRFLCVWWEHKWGRDRPVRYAFRSESEKRRWDRTSSNWGVTASHPFPMVSFIYNRCIFCGAYNKPEDYHV